jgi:hypothetical protein
MKSLIRTIILFIALNLATQGLALAQEVSEKAPQEIVKEGIGQQLQENLKESLEYAGLSRKDVEAELKRVKAEQKKAWEAWLKQWQKDMEDAVLREIAYQFTSSARQARIRAPFAIPDQRFEMEGIPWLLRDLPVMSRILDNILAQAHPIDQRSLGRYSRRPTEAIYLGGYGAIFLMEVSFPFLPTPTVQEEQNKESKKNVDPIWEQAKRQLYTQRDTENPLKTALKSAIEGTTSGSYFSADPLVEEKDDGEKVEELKGKLIKALKHAANIEGISSDDWVVLVARGWRTTHEIKQAALKGKAVSEQPCTSVLVIRAKKTDIDAFSKGELNYYQFLERVHRFPFPSYIPG